MSQHRLHNVTSFEPVGSTVYHYGYKCEVKEDGEVWAEIPKELLEVELSVGRVRAEVKKQPEPAQEPEAPAVVEEPVQEPEAPAVVEEPVQEPEATVEESAEEVQAEAADLQELAEPQAQVVKVDGRTKAGKAGKHSK